MEEKEKFSFGHLIRNIIGLIAILLMVLVIFLEIGFGILALIQIFKWVGLWIILLFPFVSIPGVANIISIIALTNYGMSVTSAILLAIVVPVVCLFLIGVADDFKN